LWHLRPEFQFADTRQKLKLKYFNPMFDIVHNYFWLLSYPTNDYQLLAKEDLMKIFVSLHLPMTNFANH
jgi:hypothetical protein